jgi:hypothetical protein
MKPPIIKLESDEAEGSAASLTLSARRPIGSNDPDGAPINAQILSNRDPHHMRHR